MRMYSLRICTAKNLGQIRPYVYGSTIFLCEEVLPDFYLKEFALGTSSLLKPYYMNFAFALIQTFSQTRFSKLVSSLSNY